jgi:hypothetical protein
MPAQAEKHPARRLADFTSFDSATAVAFEIGRVARPYNIEILYGPFFGRHLEGGLCAGKLYLLTCIQARDYLGRGCGARLHHQTHIYYAGALKHPRDTSFSHATFLLLFGCRASEHVMNFVLHEPLTFPLD